MAVAALAPKRMPAFLALLMFMLAALGTQSAALSVPPVRLSLALRALCKSSWLLNVPPIPPQEAPDDVPPGDPNKLL